LQTDGFTVARDYYTRIGHFWARSCLFPPVSSAEGIYSVKAALWADICMWLFHATIAVSVLSPAHQDGIQRVGAFQVDQSCVVAFHNYCHGKPYSPSDRFRILFQNPSMDGIRCSLFAAALASVAYAHEMKGLYAFVTDA
jgi:hypothetical protein